MALTKNILSELFYRLRPDFLMKPNSNVSSLLKPYLVSLLYSTKIHSLKTFKKPQTAYEKKISCRGM